MAVPPLAVTLAGYSTRCRVEMERAESHHSQPFDLD
jgi:hypothetical protein